MVPISETILFLFVQFFFIGLGFLAGYGVGRISAARKQAGEGEV